MAGTVIVSSPATLTCNARRASKASSNADQAQPVVGNSRPPMLSRRSPAFRPASAAGEPGVTANTNAAASGLLLNRIPYICPRWTCAR